MQHIPKPHYDSDAEHCEYSPSGSKRWINCPASIPLLRELPTKEDTGTNFFAEEGTAAHELSAYCIEEELRADTQVDRIFNDIVVDKSMAKEAQKYIDYVLNNVTWDSTLWVENRLSLEHIQENMFGTADAIIVSPDSLEVIDLKFGRGIVVEVEDNTQLMIYAIGALKHLAKHGVKFDPGFNVKMTIVQPRARHRNGPVRSDYKTVAQLKDFQKEVMLAVELTKEDEPPFGPTEEGCRWCEVGPICSAYAQYNLDIAQIEFGDFKKPKKNFKQELVERNTLTNEQLSKILKHSKAIEHWLKSITEYAIEQLKSDKEVKGYKLVYGRSNRAWEDAEKALELLIDYGTEEDRLFTKKMLSPTQAEKELSDAEFEVIKDLIFKPQGKITIAPETDGRLTVNRTQEAKDDWSNE